MGANKNGNELENFVESKLQTHGYLKIDDGSWLFKRRKDQALPKGKYYAREVSVGESAVKGKMRRVEFFLIDHEVFPDGHLIECKWQEVSGSAEDKLFRLPLDIKKTGIPTTVILDGLGFSPGIVSHLKGHVDGRIFRAIYSMVEFQIAVNRGYLSASTIKLMPQRKRVEKPTQQDLWREQA